MNNGISIVLLKPTGAVSVGFTMNFPSAPVHGQHLTFVLASSLFSVLMTNNGGTNAVINPLTLLTVTTGLGVTQGTSASYIYDAPDLMWYLCS